MSKEVIHNVLHRYTSGISTVRADDPLRDYPYPDPTNWCTFYEDFIEYEPKEDIHLPFQIDSTDLLAGTNLFIPCPVNGVITEAVTTVWKSIGTGGDLTFKNDGTTVNGLTVAIGADSAGTMDSDTPTAGHASTIVVADTDIEVLVDAAFASTGAVTGFITISPTGAPQGKGWTLTETNCTNTIVGATGKLVMTLGGADNDLGQFYLNSAPIQLTSGKKMIFEAHVKVDKASGTIGQEEVAVGLSSVQTGTNFFNSGGTDRAMDDFIGFVSYDGNANWTALQGENDTFSSEVDVVAMTDVTDMVLTIYFDGARSFFYIDGNLEATFQTNFPTSVVTPVLYIKAGESQAKVLTCDYILCAVER